MDTLVIKGMKFHAFHGYYDHEKEEGNEFEADIFLKLDLSKPAKSDNLSDTIDYSGIYSIFDSVMKDDPVNLIEHLVQRIGEKISDTFSEVHNFEIRLRKLTPDMDGNAEFSEVRMSWPRS